ncbi:MAG TPA: PfkB family carbohydrate kinase [Chryseosolibacter sp.]
MKLLAFGEILWDIIHGEEHLGGAPFNFAAHSTQCGNEAYIVSRLGTDRLGLKAFQMCIRAGVNAQLIQWDDQFPTGVVDVTLKDGQPDYVIRQNAAYDFIEFDEKTRNVNAYDFDVFYFGSLAQRNSVSFNTLHSILKTLVVKYIFYDVNLRKTANHINTVRNSVSVCNVLKLNTDEASVISEMLCGRALAYEQFCNTLSELHPNLQTIIITAAENGCYVFHRKILQHIPGIPVKIEDAIGAGDAFSAVFMKVYSETQDCLLSGRIANEVGAYVASKRGAIPQYSQRIKRLLAQTFLRSME